MTELRMAGDFRSVSIEDWREAALKALKGSALSDLDTALYEGFSVEPLFLQEHGLASARLSGEAGASPFIRGSVAPDAARPGP
ncbi:MAG: hypothetical protein HC850_15645 [Rhodomicrobium sp.]|nr:hypothetical protein [Rhodomicrobium sp.]